MADHDDVRRIAQVLPDTSGVWQEAGLALETDDRFAFSVRHKGKQKGFVWAWNEPVEPKRTESPKARRRSGPRSIRSTRRRSSRLMR